MRDRSNGWVWLAFLGLAMALSACSSDESGGPGADGGGVGQDAGISPCQGTDPDPVCSQSCAGAGDCPSGFFCAADSTCNAQCGAQGGCPFTHQCDTATGTCIAESGPCASSSPPEGCGRDCTRNADCPIAPQPMKCVGSICTAECVPETHEGCAPNERCRYDGFCEVGERLPDAGAPMDEVCNGIDDDHNGIIDDIDVGNDGICDCLKIATIGIKGQWGEGDIFAEWLSTRSNDGAVALTPQVGTMQEATDQTITPELLAPFEVIVIQDVSILDAFTPSEIDAIVQWVQNGGGLMTLIGYADPDERTNVNSILDPLGIQYGPEQILQKVGDMTVPVTNWVTHPTTDGISQVGVDNGYPVVPEMGSGAMVIASEGGYDVAAVNTVGDGKVFVWGDEWITYDSEWAATSYQVERYWLNIIKWLTPSNICQVVIPPDLG